MQLECVLRKTVLSLGASRQKVKKSREHIKESKSEMGEICKCLLTESKTVFLESSHFPED